MLYKVYSNQIVGYGAYGDIYRISPRRVIKVYRACFSKLQVADLIKDEIAGSKTNKRCLPILNTVEVRVSNKRTTYGLLKRYLPIEAGGRDVDTIRDILPPGNCRKNCWWDLKDSNLRKDTRGNIYIIDTQLNPGAIREQ